MNNNAHWLTLFPTCVVYLPVEVCCCCCYCCNQQCQYERKDMFFFLGYYFHLELHIFPFCPFVFLIRTLRVSSACLDFRIYLLFCSAISNKTEYSHSHSHHDVLTYLMGIQCARKVGKKIVCVRCARLEKGA